MRSLTTPCIYASPQCVYQLTKNRSLSSKVMPSPLHSSINSVGSRSCPDVSYVAQEYVRGSLQQAVIPDFQNAKYIRDLMDWERTLAHVHEPASRDVHTCRCLLPNANQRCT